MNFYDENTDVKKLIEKANRGDVDSMIKCVNYFSSMGDAESRELRKLRLKYIDELVKQGSVPGLIWKGDLLLEQSQAEDAVKGALSCYSLAAIQGDLFGLECIADMFFEGKGVEVDWIIARHLFWTAIHLHDYKENDLPSTMAVYKLARIIEERAKSDDELDVAKEMYEWAVEIADEWASVDEWAIKAQEGIWRLSA